MTILLAILRRYWLHIAVVAALLAAQAYAMRWAWVHGGDAARIECLKSEKAALVAAVAERDKAIADRNAAQRKVDELAKLPPKVIERVRQNPSNCSVPKPVADELRKQVAEINAAIRERGVR